MTPFRREGLVSAMPGSTGGFYLRISPEIITLIDAIGIAESCKSPGDGTVDETYFAGGTQEAAALKEIICRSGDALDDTMQHVTIAQLAGLPSNTA